MSGNPDGRTWSIGRLLLATHLPFLMLMWLVFAAAVLVLTIGIAIRGTITSSVWEPAVTVLRWFALGYGLFLINRLLPVYVAHGRTRLEFLRSITLFIVVAGAVLAALLTLGFALEGLLYRVMDWPHQVSARLLFTSPSQYPRILLAHWVMLLVWTTIGAFLAAGFYRSGGWEPVVLALGLTLVVVTGFAIGFSGLPFVGAVVDVAEVPLAATLALCAAGFLPGLAMTWALVRDIPIRNKTT
jgi:hypothetical protein